MIKFLVLMCDCLLFMRLCGTGEAVRCYKVPVDSSSFVIKLVIEKINVLLPELEFNVTNRLKL